MAYRFRICPTEASIACCRVGASQQPCGGLRAGQSDHLPLAQAIRVPRLQRSPIPAVQHLCPALLHTVQVRRLPAESRVFCGCPAMMTWHASSRGGRLAAQCRYTLLPDCSEELPKANRGCRWGRWSQQLQCKHVYLQTPHNWPWHTGSLS